MYSRTFARIQWKWVSKTVTPKRTIDSRILCDSHEDVNLFSLCSRPHFSREIPFQLWVFTNRRESLLFYCDCVWIFRFPNQETHIETLKGMISRRNASTLNQREDTLPWGWQAIRMKALSADFGLLWITQIERERERESELSLKDSMMKRIQETIVQKEEELFNYNRLSRRVCEVCSQESLFGLNWKVSLFLWDSLSFGELFVLKSNKEKCHVISSLITCKKSTSTFLL